MIKDFFKKISLGFVSFLFPLISFAQEGQGANGQSGMTASELFQLIFNVIQDLIPIVIGLAVLVFLWGVLSYVISKEDTGKSDGKKYMLWGIIALTVMVFVWGFVNFLQRSIFEQDPTRPPQQEIDQLQQIPEIENVSPGGGNRLEVLINDFLGIISDIIPIIILLAVLVFLWGVFKYSFFEGGKNKEDAKSLMIWGVIALTVMAFLWGFVRILQETAFRNTDPSSMSESADAVKSLSEQPKIEGGSENVSAGGIGVNKSINLLREIIQISIPYLISLAILIFIWGVFKYVISENPKEKSSAAQFIGWGLVLLLIMSATWAFVRIIGETVNVNVDSRQDIDKGSVNLSDLIKNKPNLR